MTRVIHRIGAWCADASNGPRGRHVARVLPWLLLAILFARSLPGLYDGNDFAVYYAAGQAVLEGTDIFESAGIAVGRTYIYPPTLAVLIAPICALPHNAAATVWALLTVLALYFSVRLTLRLFGVSDATERWTVVLILLALAARPLSSELGNGQVNLIVMCCVLVGLMAFKKGRKLSCGVWIALAACLKVTPALLVGWLVLKREWRALGGVVLGAIVFLIVVPGIAYQSPQAGWRDTVEWARRVASPVLATSEADAAQAPEPEATEPLTEKEKRRAARRARRAEERYYEQSYVAGHSLRALSFRYLTEAPLSFRDRENRVFITIADLGKSTAQRVFAGAALLVLLLTALATGVRRHDGGNRFLLEVSIWLAAMLLISPVSRKAHFVAMIPAFACLAVLLARRPNSRTVVWIGACVMCYLLAADTVTGERGGLILRNAGLYTATALIPWAVLSWRAWKGESIPMAAADPNASTE